MKYDYEKFPILKMIDGNSDFHFKYVNYPVMVGGNTVRGHIVNDIGKINNFFNIQSPIIRGDYKDTSIYYVSEKLIDSFDLCKESLMVEDLYRSLGFAKYCFLSKYFQVLIRLSEITEDNYLIVDFANIGFNSEVISHGSHAFFMGDLIDYDPNYMNLCFYTTNDPHVDLSFLLNCILAILFIRYAKVETKILPPKTKTMGVGCYYNNTTKSKITMLDSRWFTTLMKSDSFKVRGHFRLQPKKENGEWTKQLIWINEFEKSGYTAPARKLNLKED